MRHDDANDTRGRGHYLGLVLPSGVDLVGVSRLVGLVVLLVLAYQQIPRMSPDQVTYLLLGLSAGLGLRGGDVSSPFAARSPAALPAQRPIQGADQQPRELAAPAELGAAASSSSSAGHSGLAAAPSSNPDEP